MPDAVNGAMLVGMCLVLATSIVVPIVLYRRLLAQQKQQTSQFISRIDQHLGASVKLLEVRDYYEETAKALKKMLDEAYKEGNRFRQDELRKLIDRLDAMKARTLDKQVRVLEGDKSQSVKKRRRRRPRKRPEGEAPAARQDRQQTRPPRKSNGGQSNQSKPNQPRQKDAGKDGRSS